MAFTSTWMFTLYLQIKNNDYLAPEFVMRQSQKPVQVICNEFCSLQEFFHQSRVSDGRRGFVQHERPICFNFWVLQKAKNPLY